MNHHIWVAWTDRPTHATPSFRAFISHFVGSYRTLQNDGALVCLFVSAKGVFIGHWGSINYARVCSRTSKRLSNSIIWVRQSVCLTSCKPRAIYACVWTAWRKNFQWLGPLNVIAAASEAVRQSFRVTTNHISVWLFPLRALANCYCYSFEVELLFCKLYLLLFIKIYTINVCYIGTLIMLYCSNSKYCVYELTSSVLNNRGVFCQTK